MDQTVCRPAHTPTAAVDSGTQVLCEDGVSERFQTLGRIPGVSTEDLQCSLLSSWFLVKVTAKVGKMFIYFTSSVSTRDKDNKPG